MYTNYYTVVGIAHDHVLVNGLNLIGEPNPVTEMKVLTLIQHNFHLEKGLIATRKNSCNCRVKKIAAYV
jgi:hypothetical protein